MHNSDYGVEAARVQIRATDIYNSTVSSLQGNADYYRHLCAQIDKQRLAVDKVWSEIVFLKRIGDPVPEPLTETHTTRFNNLELLQNSLAETAVEIHHDRELLLHAVSILELNPYNNVLPKSRSVDLTDPNKFPDAFDEQDIHWINTAELYYQDIKTSPIMHRLEQAKRERAKEQE